MTVRRGEGESQPVHGKRVFEQRRLQTAVENATQYRYKEESSLADDARVEPERSMEEWRDVVSQRIDDAMRQGLFDNLAGRGKPLVLQRDPFLPDDQQMAVTLLRNNGLAPEWISERKSILSRIQMLRSELRQAADAMRNELEAGYSDIRQEQLRNAWTRWLSGWQTRMEKLNQRILVHNLKQPVSHLEIFLLRLPDELARAGVEQAWQRDSV